MRKLKVILLFLVTSTGLLNGQSLGKERVERVKNAVVRILIGDDPAGTGFFVSREGLIATCWHVIEPALKRDPTTNIPIDMVKLFVELESGEKIEAGITESFLNQDYQDAITNDFVILGLVSFPKSKFTLIPLGDLTEVEEGDAIYTSGFPLWEKKSILSSGILSRKWKKEETYFPSPGAAGVKTYTDVSWLDLTMNKGNSGGPVIKIGATPAEDRIIGVATFILNPFAEASENVLKQHTGADNAVAIINGLDLVKSSNIAMAAITYNSIGVSGLHSISYVKKYLQRR